VQRGEHAVLAVDRVGAAQDRPVGLLAQHHVAAAVGDEVGRVRLPARDPIEREHLRRTEPVVEEALQRLGGEIHLAAHAPTSHFQKSRPSFSTLRCSTILCTSSAPSTSRACRA